MSKCPACDAEAHPSYRAHWFRPTTPVANKVVVDTPKPAPLVVDAVANVVVDRKRDRHAKTEARREYLKLKQRESRQRRAA
jgi:DNA polymerase IIIc chi subunit